MLERTSNGQDSRVSRAESIEAGVWLETWQIGGWRHRQISEGSKCKECGFDSMMAGEGMGSKRESMVFHCDRRREVMAA
jgi:hypothetical protein